MLWMKMVNIELEHKIKLHPPLISSIPYYFKEIPNYPFYGSVTQTRLLKSKQGKKHDVIESIDTENNLQKNWRISRLVMVREF